MTTTSALFDVRFMSGLGMNRAPSSPPARTQQDEDAMPDKFTVSDAVVARLLEWGVKRIYGFPGDGVNGVMGALRRSKDRIEFIQVAHEELAGMAATAHTKFTGELGVCIATGGPGAIHMLN